MRSFLLLAALACAKDEAPGTLGGACLPGDACAVELTCVAGTCEERAQAAAADAPVAIDGQVGSWDAAADAGVVGQSPTATITHPGTETRPAGSSVPFTGEADDPEDGPLTGSALVWVSDLAGEIGQGESFSAPLSAGTHTVTLTAMDSDGNEGTDQITFTME